MREESDDSLLLTSAAQGDQQALNQLFERYRSRLKKMIRLRLNRRLQGRVDDSDVLQDAFLEATRRLPTYLAGPQSPFFLWLRRITGDKLLEIHRTHLGTQARDAQREVSLHRGALPAANSMSLAAQLLGQLTSPSQAAVKAEMRIQLQEALNSLDPLDREILALRHFEQLSNAEAAQELELEPSAASKRYLRALARLQKILRELHLTE
ncbi:MAG TPA: sigma-70 family RNA polymerase sigma factor [Pirellulales bacterium]|nr:sigma-70 family RNA polymerase sigma factor [Pirellulales bacterium]